MPNQPTPENTSIETATVQIRTLSVGAKQMTQGIFRQLIEQPVVNTAGRIDGTPWGTVNYHPDRCDNASQHLHVVWQLGDRLRRAFVLAPEDAYLRHPLVAEYVTARIHEGARRNTPRAEHGDLKVHRSVTTREIGATVYVRGVRFAGTVSPLALSVFDRSGYDEQAERLPADFEDSYQRPLRSSAEVAELLPVEAYRAAWRELSVLPQLFIGR
ncbi:hypothetical protein PV383_37255 [Streptomyces caniscabiei]|uniref:Uncharacterized protein n=1 Tax=Streptomyces caniscabiei TaxID=2746961 RepID=A0ABU4N2P2_9ACTN|nr:hypothetical protein [Streptomyces caniscabiei]MDX2948184.1 hypothetical protein [Streptomyces caniscabiei]MDX3042784.1 hypothetical protein [Streptomyces caniscabiei]